jgi:hypothetical protein
VNANIDPARVGNDGDEYDDWDLGDEEPKPDEERLAPIESMVADSMDVVVDDDEHRDDD